MSKFKSLLTLLACLPLIACGGAPTAELASGSEAIELPVAPKGCALGGSKIRNSQSNATSFATERARANLAKSIKTTIQEMTKVYVQEGTGMDGGDAQDFAEELNTRVIRSLTDFDILGGTVVKSFVLNNEAQVIVCIDTETFADAFDKMKALDQKARAALRKRAKAEFSDMDEQLKKLKNR